ARPTSLPLRADLGEPGRWGPVRLRARDRSGSHPADRVAPWRRCAALALRPGAAQQHRPARERSGTRGLERPDTPLVRCERPERALYDVPFQSGGGGAESMMGPSILNVLAGLLLGQAPAGGDTDPVRAPGGSALQFMKESALLYWIESAGTTEAL